MGMSRSGMRCLIGTWLFAAILLAPSVGRSLPVVVSIEPSASSEPVGNVFAVDIVAEIPDFVLGFGLDLSWDTTILTEVAAPTIGALWTPLAAPDGDGLAGLAPPAGISGTNVLLATVTFQGVSAGATPLTLGVTPGDLTEGFPLKPSGFAETQFIAAQVEIVPEPGTGSLVLLGSVAIAMSQARRIGRTRGACQQGRSCPGDVGHLNRSCCRDPRRKGRDRDGDLLGIG